MPKNKFFGAAFALKVFPGSAFKLVIPGADRESPFQYTFLRDKKCRQKIYYGIRLVHAKEPGSNFCGDRIK